MKFEESTCITERGYTVTSDLRLQVNTDKIYCQTEVLMHTVYFTRGNQPCCGDSQCCLLNYRQLIIAIISTDYFILGNQLCCGDRQCCLLN